MPRLGWSLFHTFDRDTSEWNVPLPYPMQKWPKNNANIKACRSVTFLRIEPLPTPDISFFPHIKKESIANKDNSDR